MICKIAQEKCSLEIKCEIVSEITKVFLGWLIELFQQEYYKNTMNFAKFLEYQQIYMWLVEFISKIFEEDEEDEFDSDSSLEDALLSSRLRRSNYYQNWALWES